jgi:hypothetical protein
MTREQCPICGALSYEVIDCSCDIGDHHTQRGTIEGCHACGWTPDMFEPEQASTASEGGDGLPF